MREQAELEGDVQDDESQRIGLGICLAVYLSAEQVADSTALTADEGERLMLTAEGWCSA